MKTYYLFDIDREDYSDTIGNEAFLSDHLDYIGLYDGEPEYWQSVEGYESEAIRIAADSGLNIAIVDAETLVIVTEVFTKNNS